VVVEMAMVSRGTTGVERQVGAMEPELRVEEVETGVERRERKVGSLARAVATVVGAAWGADWATAVAAAAAAA
jgi:hypothetical protein